MLFYTIFISNSVLIKQLEHDTKQNEMLIGIPYYKHLHENR